MLLSDVLVSMFIGASSGEAKNRAAIPWIKIKVWWNFTRANCPTVPSEDNSGKLRKKLLAKATTGGQSEKLKQHINKY